MKCRKCGVDKPEGAFYKDKNGYIRKICKKCVIQQSRDNQLKNAEHRKKYCQEYHAKHKKSRGLKDAEYRAKINALKTSCRKCGDSRLYVIDFHHIDPAEKKFNIHRKTSKRDFSIIEAEARKCICLCRNCHMEFHYFYGMNPENPKQALIDYLEKES